MTYVPNKWNTYVLTVFPSSLGPVAMRWFDGMDEGSISFFKELTRSFGDWFVTCSKVPQPLDSLLSMVIKEGGTLKTYSDRLWETFNKIDRDFEDVAIRKFKVGFPTEHDLGKSLTMKPVWSMRQLIDQIDEHKWVEKDDNSLKCILVICFYRHYLLITMLNLYN